MRFIVFPDKKATFERWKPGMCEADFLLRGFNLCCSAVVYVTARTAKEAGYDHYDIKLYRKNLSLLSSVLSWIHRHWYLS